MNGALESETRALPRALEIAGDALRERKDEAFTSCGDCVTQENRPEAPLTPEKTIDKDQPPTPTMNLKVLASAASSDIRDREQQTRKTLNFDEPDYDKQDDEKAVTSMGRKSKSLGLLCTRFLTKYDLPEKQNTEICLDEIALSLKVERRRVYDIINVLESLEIVVRLAKNRYRWQGREQLEPTLAKLKRLSGPAMMDQENVPQTEVSGARQREKSLGILSQKFIMMFLVAADKPVYLEDAARVLIGTHEQDAAKCKTKVRRLYDIANILTSLGLVEKVQVQLPSPQGKKPAFKWIGPNVEEAQKRYQVVDFNSDSTAANVMALSPSPDHPYAPPGKRRRFTSKHSLLDNMKVIQKPDSADTEPTIFTSPLSQWSSSSTYGPTHVDDDVVPAVTGLIRLKMRRVQSYDAGAPRILPALPQRQKPPVFQSPNGADPIMASLTTVIDPVPATLDISMLSPPISPFPGQCILEQPSSDHQFGLGLLSPTTLRVVTHSTEHHPPPSSWVQPSATSSDISESVTATSASTPTSAASTLTSASPTPESKPKCHLIACMAPCPGGHSEEVSCLDVIGRSGDSQTKVEGSQSKGSEAQDEMPPHMTVVYELCQSANAQSASSPPQKPQSAFLVQRQHLQELLSAKNLSPSKVSEEPYYVVRASASPSAGEKHPIVSLLAEAQPVAQKL